MKAKIINFTTKKTGYGHWLITMKIENPFLNLADNDEYWRFNEREEEPEYLTIKHTTTDSRAIDGYDGFEQALAGQCSRANDIPEDLIDVTTLRDSEEE